MRRKYIIGSIVGVGIVALAAAALVFKPWLLFVDVRVDEALPTVPSVTPMPVPSESGSTPEPAADPVQLASGDLISHEHETSGTVRVIENPDGTRVLALENLSTSNGPDVHVWLSAAPVVPGPDGWYAADDAEWVDLGLLKGNLGNQVYAVPEGVDLAAYPNVYLWCAQFAVSFGAAALTV
jgi:hypothetical protein